MRVCRRESRLVKQGAWSPPYRPEEVEGPECLAEGSVGPLERAWKELARSWKGQEKELALKR